STQPPVPLPTATPVVETAVVTSGVGVWLRSVPGVDGEQVEWLLANTQVVLLAGQATADEFEWQEVQAPSGNVGWVAVPFIEPTAP
ncbi:MAG: SH3 domain-containing protein, partial [Anaerolineales bacterium]|nr:SH3 domain-containing protein [Anaerolineales bacterium]